ncbi:MAG TPA: aspartate--tRNA ligase, partial [Frankiaceae bacterium]|nr:aspartate--tRNA ligase [Frankiaceae bacterium]
MIRTHEAGALRREDAGRQVELAGWVARRRDHGGVAFVDLRDASGIVQVVVRDAEVGHDLRGEYCVRIAGTVAARPAGNENPDLPTGDVEVIAAEVEILSRSDPLPFPVADGGGHEVGEEARLRWRYLDLRRPAPARALRIRSHTTRVIREVMAEHRFLDVETPYLTRSTPEGARDFLVPVRLQPGTWYALPQSPQLFKQLLMVAGLERYYQIVRCFRDEDFRADRQPEFTQLDVEMSFAEQDDVIALSEDVLARVWGEVAGVGVARPFPRMTYAEAMRRFGSDRPDLRYGLELVDLTGYFAGTGFRVFAGARHVGALVVPGGASSTRRELDGWQEWARGRGARGVAYVLVGRSGIPGGGIAKNLSEAELRGLPAAAGAAPGDAVFFAAGSRHDALELLGALRQAVARERGLVPAGRWEFLWVTDFPMFERTDDGGWTAVHHPFTRPRPQDERDFHDRPGEALARAYDVVVNGVEIGGGSLRIHEAEMQQRVFDVIGLSKEDAEAKFGFLL